MLTKALRVERNDRDAAIATPTMTAAAPHKIMTRGNLPSQGITATVKRDMLYISRADVVTIDMPRTMRMNLPNPPRREIRISPSTPPRPPEAYAEVHEGMEGIELPIAAPRTIISENGTYSPAKQYRARRSRGACGGI
jgi:hypothetical protein